MTEQGRNETDQIVLVCVCQAARIDPGNFPKPNRCWCRSVASLCSVNGLLSTPPSRIGSISIFMLSHLPGCFFTFPQTHLSTPDSFPGPSPDFLARIHSIPGILGSDPDSAGGAVSAVGLGRSDRSDSGIVAAALPAMVPFSISFPSLHAFPSVHRATPSGLGHPAFLRVVSSSLYVWTESCAEVCVFVER